ncbi:MFS transporter [Paenibacillus macerans]|uniref:Major Facilitator Superfamily protein n=1 Tax=Paenibacillus macerans TaxID=44252 RepID=A0A090ZF03_PAEMA|nr:MFS transporter [Paenibacillus macerans]KFN08810.1 major Facilitator Superfamily protein [Paenibacillus macerans]MBS5914546.1 MFS transporter [Paenibacillus macerans]MCY7560093.1 MFS transporter [Paenibacillus macerans]MEC0139651.1 MFS transporter [Paenibacillus macerans]MEC0150445.1 MFS transporter [Paenibacillus macerans]
MKRLIWLGCWSYLLIGLAHVVVGSLMPNLLEQYGKDYSAGGSLIFAQFAGFLVGVLVSPLLLAKFGKIYGLLIATGMLCTAEVCYSLLPPWEWMYAIGAVAGFGFGMIEAVIGTIILVAVTEGTAVAMSRLEVFFGLGALLMPVAAGFFIRAEAWRFSFLVVAGLAFIMLFAWGRGNFGEFRGALYAKGKRQDKKGGWLKQYQGARGLLLAVFIVFFFFYVGTEMSFVNFLPSLLIEKLGLDKPTAAFSVTLFWIAMTCGRLVAGIIAEKISYSRYVLWSCIVSFALIALFSLTGGKVVTYILILLFGLFMSGLFSIALVFANKLLVGAEESTPSLLIASGGVGGAVLPLIMGKTMDLGGAYASSWLLAGFLMLLALLSIFAVFIQRSRGSALAAAVSAESNG